jgi:HNH endonuclease
MSALTWSEIVRIVEERAAGRCEYCRMHQDLQGATFHVEHIVPTSKGGRSDPENLAWACRGCNLAKSNRIEIPDPETGAQVPLFHPRRDEWSTHFRWKDHRLIGQTPVGRATIVAFDLNHARRIRIRQAEEHFGWFPP